MAQRKYCKNTVSGRQGRGKKYPAKVRAEVVMAMICSNSICAVARKYGVPESTIRSWMAEEAGKPDEDARARDFAIGGLLKSEAEDLQDAAETGLVVRSAPGTYDRQLSDGERTELAKQLERYEALAMTDKDAANVATVLLNAAANAAALVPRDEGGSQSTAPAVLMEAKDDAEQQEVVLDGTAGD